MTKPLPLKQDQPPDDVTVVLRAGVMTADNVRRSAERTFDVYAVYGISVEGVIDTTVQEACRGERIAGYRRVRLSTFGRLREAGFALLATFDHPHFTAGPGGPQRADPGPARPLLRRPDPESWSTARGVTWPSGKEIVAMADTYDIAVDFMDMTNDRRLWVRAADVREGFEAAVGRYAIVGDDDADPKVARIVAIDENGHLQLEVLPGPIDAHRDALARA